MDYAAKLHGEGVLFFANGLGVVARSKIFYDKSRRFAEAIAVSGRFSDGLQGYFEAEANDPGLNPDGASNWPDRRKRILARKRVYAWGQLGDPTLRIRYPR